MCLLDATADNLLEASASKLPLGPTEFTWDTISASAVGTGTGTRTGDMGAIVAPEGIDAAAGITIEVTKLLTVMGRIWPPGASVCTSWTDLGMLSAIDEISSTGAVMMIVRVATRLWRVSVTVHWECVITAVWGYT